MDRASRLKMIALAMFLLVTAGCVTTEKNIRQTGEWEQARLTQDASIVFGGIQWIENGKEKKIGSGMFEFGVKPGLLRLEDKSRHFGEVDEGGDFVWTLQKGTYVMFRINYRDPWSGNYFFVPKVAFKVPDNGGIYYVGTVKVEFESKRDFIGGLSGSAKIQVLDEANESYPFMVKKLRVSDEAIEKSLMVHEKRLPGTIDTTPEFQMAIQLLNALF